MYENTGKNWKKMKKKKKTVQDLKAKISPIKIYFKLRETLKWKKKWVIKQELQRQASPTEYKWQRENLTHWRHSRINSHCSTKKMLNCKHTMKHPKNMGSHKQNLFENASHRGQR